MFKKFDSIERKLTRLESLDNLDTDDKYHLPISNEEDFQAFNNALLDIEIKKLW